MKCVTLTCLLALGWAAACVSAPPPPPLRSAMPLLPSLEERQLLLAKARAHPDRLQRLPSPAGVLGRAQPHSRAPRSLAELNQNRTRSLYVRRAAAGAQPVREPQPASAGRVSAGLRIVNGNKAVLGQFPWQAGVLANFGASGKAWCGGSILHSRWILTAGHCVDDQAIDYTISVGSLGSEQGSEPSRVVFKGVNEFYQHPAYNPYFIDNDVALIKVPSAIPFNAWCGPVRLPSYSMAADMMVGKTGTVSGWGLTKDNDKWITSDLMYVQNTIDDGKACFNYYGNSWIPNKICVQTKDLHSFCSGDSGGAFTIVEEDGAHTQLGIVSFGARKGCAFGLPTAYTRVASFLDFISETTNIAIRD